MKAVLQRVTHAQVEVAGRAVGRIGPGLLILLGVCAGDTGRECALLADKAAGLRIFEDGAGKMNLSLCDVGGSALVVSQFTLCADCRKGRRPSFTGAAQPAVAEGLYKNFIGLLRAKPQIAAVECGVFGADMQVSLLNDGPVTLVLDTAGL